LEYKQTQLESLYQLIRQSDEFYRQASQDIITWEDAFNTYKIAEERANELSYEVGHVLYRLGVMYYRGRGIGRNLLEAERYFKMAILKLFVDAEQGNVQAQFDLGCCYDYGYGTLFDKQKALKYYSLAADSQPGHIDASYNLATMYTQGDVGPKDQELALKYFKRAATQGDVESQIIVFTAYKDCKDYAQSLAYLLMALRCDQKKYQIVQSCNRPLDSNF